VNSERLEEIKERCEKEKLSSLYQFIKGLLAKLAGVRDGEDEVDSL